MIMFCLSTERLEDLINLFDITFWLQLSYVDIKDFKTICIYAPEKLSLGTKKRRI